ncbi:hypothetical protein IT400_03860 [Candidatus Nomurabacteria bacterium]|nr:hypothetical protein [Candidatus Nomurabacteria bacterium]
MVLDENIVHLKMKKTSLSKLGKAVIQAYLETNPFNEPILEIESSNERFDLNQTFLATETNGVDEVRFLPENKVYQQTRYYFWHGLMGMNLIPFREKKSFLDAIPEVDEEEIIYIGMLPTHLIRKTIVSTEKRLFGWGEGDTVCYMIYYLHPDQRDAIEINYQSNSYQEVMQEESDRITELTSVGKGSYS